MIEGLTFDVGEASLRVGDRLDLLPHAHPAWH